MSRRFRHLPWKQVCYLGVTALMTVYSINTQSALTIVIWCLWVLVGGILWFSS